MISKDLYNTDEIGATIFLGTGVGEPRTLVKHLMSTDSAHFKDLELIQVAVDVSRQAMEQASLVVGEPGQGHIIAEAIFIKDQKGITPLIIGNIEKKDEPISTEY